jgi:hypothetical protein
MDKFYRQNLMLNFKHKISGILLRIGFNDTC